MPWKSKKAGSCALDEHILGQIYLHNRLRPKHFIWGLKCNYGSAIMLKNICMLVEFKLFPSLTLSFGFHKYEPCSASKELESRGYQYEWN